jgi:hypothetical protein
MLRRWATAIGKIALVGFLGWHMGVVGVSTLPDRTSSQFIQNLRGSVAPYSDPYMFATSQWQNWAMFSEGSFSRIFKHEMQAWNAKTNMWETVQKLGFKDLPILTTARDTALLRSIDSDTAWPERERYLQLQCAELGLSPGTWVRMNYQYFDMPLPEEPLPGNWWENWEPDWEPWEDTHWTKCPDPTTPKDTWPVPQPESSSSAS